LNDEFGSRLCFELERAARGRSFCWTMPALGVRCSGQSREVPGARGLCHASL